MKVLLLFVLILGSASASARTKFFKVRFTADTEEVLKDKVKQAIPKILTGKLRGTFHRQQCWPNNERTIKILSVHIGESYKVDRNGKLVPYYTGVVNYRHRRCRKD